MKDFFGRTTLIPVEPTYREIVGLVKNGEFLSIETNENNYEIEVLNKVSEEPKYGFFLDIRQETDEIFSVTIKKYSEENNITKSITGNVLVLMSIQP